jgi:type I restriction enzyme S subunit
MANKVNMYGKNNLPDGWEWKRLGEITDINPRLNKYDISDDCAVSFVPMPAVGADNGCIDVTQLRPAKELKKGYTSFKEGDVLFAKITPCMENGKMAVVPKLNNGIGFGSTEFHVLRPKQSINAKYLYYFVSNVSFRREAAHSMTGAVGQKRVPAVFISNHSIPLAPLAQQKLIVAEIEKQFSRLDEAIAGLRRAKENIKRYKASVLKAAVEGKLTEEWRKAHPNVESGEVLLKRILAERKKKWEEKNPGKKYKEPVAPDTSNLPELPKGWVWTTVEQAGAFGEQAVLTGPFGSNLGSSDFQESGIPVITIGCLKEDGISLGKAAYVNKTRAKELKRYSLKEGDILFSRMAAVGRAGYVTSGFENAIFNYHIMRLRLNIKAVSPAFFIAYVRGAKRVVDYLREINHGFTRDGINTTQLLSLPVALPSITEQEKIVEEIDRKISIALMMDAVFETNQKSSNMLRQSILTQTFRGKYYCY